MRLGERNVFTCGSNASQTSTKVVWVVEFVSVCTLTKWPWSQVYTTLFTTLVFCGNCGLGTSQMVKLPILLDKMPPGTLSSWAGLRKLHIWDLQVAQWYWGQESELATPDPSLFYAVANDRSIWPCVLDPCHVSQKGWCTFCLRPCWLFSKCVVKKFNFGLITILRLLSVLFGIFFWWLNHAVQVPPNCASWKSHATLFQRVLYVSWCNLWGFPEQFSRQLWLKYLLVYMTLAWFQ